MIISIPDDISAERRKHLLEVYPIIYAIWYSEGSLSKAAEFLGINKRTIYNLVKDSHDLKVFANTRDYYTRENRIKKIAGEKNEDLISSVSFKIYRFYLRQTEKSFWFNQLSDEEKEKVRQNFRKTYLGGN